MLGVVVVVAVLIVMVAAAVVTAAGLGRSSTRRFPVLVPAFPCVALDSAGRSLERRLVARVLMFCLSLSAWESPEMQSRSHNMRILPLRRWHREERSEPVPTVQADEHLG